MLKERSGGLCRRRWHLDEMDVKLNGETHYLWRPADQEGEVLALLEQMLPLGRN
ncbi:DDE-type integrase/transposase/recombinase [Tsuneonella sp. HG222]